MISEKVNNINKKLSQTFGGTFCFEKYYNTTLHLHTGKTHSCYHPKHHKISLKEIEKDPSALHNTSQKKLERISMLKGEKISGCNYCWNIEKLGKEYISDRLERSAATYNEKRLREVQEKGPNHNYNPRYIEVSFGNTCNFKCGYCNPQTSSSYYQEIKKYGPYSIVKENTNYIDSHKIYEEENNPYIEAWWKWWPSLKKDLEVFRITGGEPLLQKSTWHILEDIEKNPLKHLEFMINSNMGVPMELVKKLCLSVNNLEQKEKIKAFHLFTSIDTWGKRAEYIRTGMNLKVWEDNIDYYLSSTNGKITFIVTVNILSVSKIKRLFEKILEWRKKYIIKENMFFINRIHFDTPYLTYPIQYDINILPKESFIPYMNEALEYIKENTDDTDPRKFRTIEYLKFKRVVDYMTTTQYSKIKLLQGRSDFYKWFEEHDRRRHTNLLSTFPEYNDFIEQCKKNNTVKKFFQSKGLPSKSS